MSDDFEVQRVPVRFFRIAPSKPWYENDFAVKHIEVDDEQITIEVTSRVPIGDVTWWVDLTVTGIGDE